MPTIAPHLEEKET